MPRLTRGFARFALLCALVLPTLPAAAHVSLEQATTIANTTYKAVLRVPHGCEGEATKTLTVRIPEGIINVKPMPKAGWTLATKTTDYAKPYDYFGRTLTSGVTEIVWSGGELADAHYDEFVFTGRIAGTIEPGHVFAIPTIQTCATKTAAWTEIAAPGVDPHSLKMPAPVLRVQATPAAPKTTEATIKHGDLVITAPWTRQPPQGARVAGGFMRITNTGMTPDRLLGGAAPFAKRFEVHEMTVEGGVMRMRELAKGLEIKPGETVELKPGGLHVMYMDITQAPVAGQAVKTTLRFERAGTIEIDVPVQAGAPSGGHRADHKH